MIVGVPQEMKDNETRVKIVPAGAAAFQTNNYEGWVETCAELGSRFMDQDCLEAGASIVFTAKKS
jgi:alanine dehydrogenase